MSTGIISDQAAVLPNSTLIVVAIVFTILHIGLFTSVVFFKKKLHPMYYMFLVLATMLYVSPFNNVTVSNTGRWLRLYIIGLTAVLGLLLYRPKRIGLPAKAALLFALYMIVNAIRADDAIIAIVYKGIFLLSLVAGLMIAHSVRDPSKIFKQLHWFVFLMAIYSINFIYYIATNPSFTVGGRLNYGPLGVMALAASVAAVFVICAFVAMYDTSTKWRIAAVFVCLVMGTVVLLTGSRGPTAAAVGATFLMSLPLIKRPSQLVTLLLLIAIGVAVVIGSGIEMPHLMRAIGLNRSDSIEELANGRLQIWHAALAGFRQNPLLGCGYIQTGTFARQVGRSAHSSYVQLISEGGIVGCVVFAGFCITVFYCLVTVFIHGGKRPEIGTLRCLPIGCLAFAGIFGLGEASTLYGTTFSAVLLMLGIGYTDWMYMTIRQPHTLSKSILVRRKKIPPYPLLDGQGAK